MEQWTTTEDTKLAAAFGTLGMPLRINRMLDEKSGRATCRFSIGLINVEGNYRTAQLRHALTTGQMEEKAPGHPLLTILRTFANRELLLDFQKKGTGILLQPVAGAATWQYREAMGGLPGVKRDDAVIKTGDLKLAAALATIGLPLLKLEGSAGNFTYWVSSKTVDGKFINAGEMITAWYEDKESVPWREPFAQAMRGLYNRERLLDAVRVTERKVLLRPTRGIKSAIISETHASPEAWDIVRNFLGA